MIIRQFKKIALIHPKIGAYELRIHSNTRQAAHHQCKLVEKHKYTVRDSVLEQGLNDLARVVHNPA
jgi:hypothetical protein